MKETRILMGMPIEIEIVGNDTEVRRASDASGEMREVFAIVEKTKKETNGYFDIRRPDVSIDPSGIVKGYAIDAKGIATLTSGFEEYTNVFS